MSTPEGNSAWRALRDDVNSKGEPVSVDQDGPMMSTPDARPFGTVSATVRRAVNAIHPELMEIVDSALLPLDTPMQTCPECSERYVRPAPGTERTGVCRVCVLRAFARRREELEAELRAQTAANAAKKRLERTRDELDPHRRRGHAPFRLCTSCGERLPPLARHPEQLCVSCLDRDEQRQRVKGATPMNDPDQALPQNADPLMAAIDRALDPAVALEDKLSEAARGVATAVDADAGAEEIETAEEQPVTIGQDGRHADSTGPVSALYRAIDAGIAQNER